MRKSVVQITLTMITFDDTSRTRVVMASVPDSAGMEVCYSRSDYRDAGEALSLDSVVMSVLGQVCPQAVYTLEKSVGVEIGPPPGAE